jgi:hypothetical protein
MQLVWNINEDVQARRWPRSRAGGQPAPHRPPPLCALSFNVELATAPVNVLERWAETGLPIPGAEFRYAAVDKNGNPLRPIPYEELDLNASWESFNLRHELTDQGIKKFVVDYKSTLQPAA